VCNRYRGVVDEFEPARCRDVQLHVLVFRDEQYHTRSDRCGCDASESDQRHGGAAAVHLCGRDSFLTCCNLIAYSVFSPGGDTRKVGARLSGNFMSWIWLSAMIFSPLMFIINISSTESFFKASGIPISEEPNLVGQWSTVMGAGLVVVAAAINKWTDHRQMKREGESNTAEGQGTVESVHMINHSQYKWEQGNSIAPGQGIEQSIHV
jgi:hypothetical protein